MPYINVNDVYIMDNTGKQVDDAVDYALYNSNRNLLDNWYFVGGGSQLGEGVLPINQKELTSYPEAGYNIDRWISTTLTVETDGITATGALYQVQDAAFMSRLLGKTLTASILFADGTLHTGTLTLPTALPSSATMYTYSGGQSVSGVTAQLYLTVAGSAQFLRISTTKKIAAVKVEIGAYSTLLNDAPPSYSEELRKCQYYFRRVKGDVYLCSGMIINDSSVVFPFPFEMYKTPTVSKTGVISCVSNGGILPITAIQSVGRTTNAIQVRFTTSGATPYAAALLTPQNGGYIDFSANI